MSEDEAHFRWQGPPDGLTFKATARRMTVTRIGDRDIHIPLEPGDTLKIGLTKANGEVAGTLEWIEH
jgi:hypothetical protein